MKPIRKAIFPVAGLGTRFLPATKAIPKEMLPVVDRPVIQHVVDEARAAGIEHCIFVTGRNKGAIEDHFDIQYELDRILKDRNRHADLEALAKDLPPAGQSSFTRQQEPLGLGHAVWCARDIVGDEPFAVLLPDMLHQSDEPCLKGMIERYNRDGGNVIGLYNVPESETHQYGIADIDGAQGQERIRGMVEKPKSGTAPSTLAISGRYILSPKIFNILETQSRGAGGEIQLTDAMANLMKSEPFYGHIFKGRVHDTGHRHGFLVANIAYALARPDLAPSLRAAIHDLLKGS
jgi:UTP--glucose-1-phosphate uridylyltransferase